MSFGTERVTLFLKKGGLRTLKAVSAGAFVSPERARVLIRKLHASKRIHIAAWKRQHIGPFLPLWQWGSGEDAVKPEPMPPSEWQRRYRAKKRLANAA